MDFVWDNLGEPVPEETFTHSHLQLGKGKFLFFLGGGIGQRSVT